jgi:hypothetical protein
MQCNLPPKVVRSCGITLLELTVILCILLFLMAVLSVGARAWRGASDRSSCILNQRNLQVAMRSYQNFFGYECGGRPRSEYGTQDIARHLLQRGYITQGLYDQAKGSRPCAGGGTCVASPPDVFPMPGELYMNCTLSGPGKHLPDNTNGW